MLSTTTRLQDSRFDPSARRSSPEDLDLILCGTKPSNLETRHRSRAGGCMILSHPDLLPRPSGVQWSIPTRNGVLETRRGCSTVSDPGGPLDSANPPTPGFSHVALSSSTEQCKTASMSIVPLDRSASVSDIPPRRRTSQCVPQYLTMPEVDFARKLHLFASLLHMH